MGHPEWSCGRIFEDFGINFWWIFWVKGWLERKNVTERPLRIGIQAVFMEILEPLLRFIESITKSKNFLSNFCDFSWLNDSNWLLRNRIQAVLSLPEDPGASSTSKNFLRNFLAAKFSKNRRGAPPRAHPEHDFIKKQFYWCILLVLYWD